jgi:hypothetical protein
VPYRSTSTSCRTANTSNSWSSSSAYCPFRSRATCASKAACSESTAAR